MNSYLSDRLLVKNINNILSPWEKIKINKTRRRNCVSAEVKTTN